MADPNLFTTVTDNTFLPFGTKIIPDVDAGYGNTPFDITPIFENGLQVGTTSYSDLYVLLSGAVSVNSDQYFPYVSPFTSDFAIFGTFFLEPESYPELYETAGVYLDLNAARDSVVVTWDNVPAENYSSDPTPLSFQMEIVDLGNNNAEVIYRYGDTGDGYRYAELGLSNETQTYIYGLGASLEGDLDTVPGNSGVAGVWQFRLLDGMLQPAEDLAGNVVTGTSGDDVLEATPLGDTISAGDGDDTVTGGGSSDSISGGNGDDSLTGEAGGDTIAGDGGADTIVGGYGDDLLLGGNGDDEIIEDFYASWGYDTIEGGDGNDTISASHGRDLVAGQDGDDVLNGGYGDDTIYAGDGDDFVWGGLGTDIVEGGAGADRFYTSEHASDTMIIVDYDPDEGDAVIINGDVYDPEDVQMRFDGYVMDHLGNIGWSDLSIGVLDDNADYRALFTFRNTVGIDEIEVRVWAPETGGGELIMFDVDALL